MNKIFIALVLVVGLSGNVFAVDWFFFGFANMITRNIVSTELAENNWIILSFLTPIFLVIYLLPSILALYKNIQNKNIILITNIGLPFFYILVLMFLYSDNVFTFMNRTFAISWFATLIVALTDKKQIEEDNKVSNEKNDTDLSLIKKIGELNKLKEQGILTEEEFSDLKSKLIAKE